MVRHHVIHPWWTWASFPRCHPSISICIHALPSIYPVWMPLDRKDWEWWPHHPILSSNTNLLFPQWQCHNLSGKACDIHTSFHVIHHILYLLQPSKHSFATYQLNRRLLARLLASVFGNLLALSFSSFCPFFFLTSTMSSPCLVCKVCHFVLTMHLPWIHQCSVL